MGLNIWILVDRLSTYHPHIHIEDDTKTVEGVRLYQKGESIKLNLLYVTTNSEYKGIDDKRILLFSDKVMIQLDTCDIFAVMNQLLNYFEQYRRWYNLCEQLIRDKCDLNELLYSVLDVFNETLVIENGQGFFLYQICNRSRYLSQNKKMTDDQKRAINFIEKVVKNRGWSFGDFKVLSDYRKTYEENVVLVSHPDYEGIPALLRPLYHNGIFWGNLVKSCVLSLPSKGEMKLFDLFGEMIEEWLKLNVMQISPSESLRKCFVRLLTDAMENDCLQFQNEMQNRNAQTNSEYRLCHVESTSYDKNHLYYLSTRLEYMGGLLCAVNNNKLSILLSEKEISSRTRKDFETFIKESDCFAIMSPVFMTPDQIHIHNTLLENARMFCQRLAGEIYYYESYAIPCVLKELRENSSIFLMHPALEILRDYDRENQTNLTETLREFLLLERNYYATAQKLFLHRNSVQYRIERVVQLTGVNLDNAETRLHLLMNLF